jgi:hypothetical protein
VEKMQIRVVCLVVVTTMIYWRSLSGRLSEKKLLKRRGKRLDSRRRYSGNECKKRNNKLQIKLIKRKRKSVVNGCLKTKRVVEVTRTCHHN